MTLVYISNELRESRDKSAEIIVDYFVEIFGVPSSVIDIGCCEGNWLVKFKKFGVAHIAGEDGTEMLPHLKIDLDEFSVVDLEIPRKRSQKYDLAMSLEVAEHLSEERSDGFVRELCDLSDVVLFSAAIPGQGGANHINEQWPDYWIEKFAENLYDCNDCLRLPLWNNPDIAPWYKQNMMLFLNMNIERASPFRKLFYEKYDASKPTGRRFVVKHENYLGRLVNDVIFSARVKDIEELKANLNFLIK